MPLYDYLCAACGAQFEMIVSGADAAVTCQGCGAADVKRMLSAPAAYSGGSRNAVPGPADTACCGSSPSTAGCAGPGSCCGKGPGF